MTLFKTIWEFTLDIFFPPICLNCKTYLQKQEKEDLLCGSCFRNIKIFKTVLRPEKEFILAAVSSYDEPALKELIHYFKYKRFIKAGQTMEKLLADYFINVPLSKIATAVIPVPLHPGRQREEDSTNPR